MPAWHRHVLLAAIALAIVGTIGHLRQITGGKATPQSESAQHDAVATPHSNFGTDVSSGGAVTSDSSQQPWYLSPRFLSLGGSVLGGFVIGWAMRVFLKTTMLIGLAAAAVFSGLSYFRVMNVDLTAVHQQYSSDINWLSDQASRLKDIAIAHLPVHAGGLFGMFMGFRRPRL